MSEVNPEEAIKKLKADRKKLLDILQTLLSDTQTFFKPGNKMQNAAEASIKLRGSLAQPRESCPDMTFFDGRLVNSCRLDEHRRYGGLLTAVPRTRRETNADSPLPCA